FDCTPSRKYGNLATHLEVRSRITVENGSEGAAPGKRMNRFRLLPRCEELFRRLTVTNERKWQAVFKRCPELARSLECRPPRLARSASYTEKRDHIQEPGRSKRHGKCSLHRKHLQSRVREGRKDLYVGYKTRKRRGQQTT